jgi:hypothetical protein
MVAQSRMPVAKTKLPAALRRRLGNRDRSWESEAETILREVAFVLKLTQRVREDILDETDRNKR